MHPVACRSLLFLVLAVAAASLAACDGSDGDEPAAAGGLGSLVASVGDLSIYAAALPAPPADVAAVYFAVVNGGEEDDTLVSVSAAIAGQVMLHETVVEGDSSRMTHLEDGIPIPAGSTVRLEPGGLHVMLMGLSDRPVEGELVAVTLHFERAGEVAIEVPVVPYSEVESSGE
jgi:hypothetical protein